jgi:hypothetical protein
MLGHSSSSASGMTPGSMQGLQHVQLRYNLPFILILNLSSTNILAASSTPKIGFIIGFGSSNSQISFIALEDIQIFLTYPAYKWVQALVVFLLGGSQMANQALF